MCILVEYSGIRNVYIINIFYLLYQLFLYNIVQNLALYKDKDFTENYIYKMHEKSHRLTRRTII